MERMASDSVIKSLIMALGLIVTLSLAANAQETSYTGSIRQIFDRYCVVCHGGKAPEHADFKKNKQNFISDGLGPKMDSYPHLIQFVGWPDSGAVMRRLDDGNNTKDRKPGNMYQFLGATEEERQQNLRSFKDWVGNWTLKRFPELTREDLAGIKVRY